MSPFTAFTAKADSMAKATRIKRSDEGMAAVEMRGA